MNLRDCAGGADRFVVVDTETTGVYNSDRIVELAMVTLSLDGEVVDEFETLVNPQRDIGATHIHGVTPSMVTQAPTFAEVAGDVAVRLHGACLVAHNAPFDVRMLMLEYGRLDCDFESPQVADTYRGSKQRLGDACATYGISLHGAHSALGDAHATAELFRQLGPHCGTGAPTRAPEGFSPTHRVCRRTDTTPETIGEPPFLARLAAQLSFAGLDVSVQQYLDMLGRAVEDLHLDKTERAELADIARSLGLTEGQLTQAHRRYVNEMLDAAIADDVVTDEEYDALIRVASALDIGQELVERRVASYRAGSEGVTLGPGVGVVFTGNHDWSRSQLEARAKEMGMIPKPGVSGKVGLVCAVDAASSSGKAAKARSLGIPVIPIDEFLAAGPGDTVAGSVAQQALQVITCAKCWSTWTAEPGEVGSSNAVCSDCASLAP